MVRTLILEDYLPLGRAMKRALSIPSGTSSSHREAEGASVVLTKSCTEALLAEGWFERAVVDLELPDGSGVDVARALMAAGRVERVVFFTACREPEALSAALQLGQVVDKAAGIEFLLEILRRGSDAAAAKAIAVGETVPRGGGAFGSSGRSGTRRILR